MTVAELIYIAAGSPPMDGDIQGICRTCGAKSTGALFAKWVKDSFTDIDKIAPGEIVCQACLFGFSDQNEPITRMRGQWWPDAEAAFSAPLNASRLDDWRKKTHKDAGARPASPKEIGLREAFSGWAIPAKTRNFSHFVKDGQWYPLSKGNKAEMRRLLLSGCEVAVIADSGQKHLIFRAKPGWWQFEEQSMLPCPELLAQLLAPIEALYNAGASKTEIETGNYDARTIQKIGVATWRLQEQQLKAKRGGLPFKLAIFLSQKEEIEDGGE